MHPDVPPVVDMTKHLEVEELLERRPDLLAVIAKCIICQRRADMTGVFVVNRKHAAFYGAPPMKTRKFVYGFAVRVLSLRTEQSFAADRSEVF